MCFEIVFCKLFDFFFNFTATTEIYTLSLHDALPICSKHALRVELHALDGQLAMAQRHDGVAGGSAGGDLEFAGQAVLGDDERVVAGAGHHGRNAAEDGAAVVGDLAGLAVHQPGRAYDLAPRSEERRASQTWKT